MSAQLNISDNVKLHATVQYITSKYLRNNISVSTTSRSFYLSNVYGRELRETEDKMILDKTHSIIRLSDAKSL